MEFKNKITQYREKLDKTLACHDLTDVEKIRALVRDKLIHSSQHGTKGYADITLAKRTDEVTNFLDMLRSASVNDDDSKNREASHAQWKLKQDNEEYRVMYREGPPGTPFHMLLVEGYVDGPVDSCLCVSWETTLYNKWWPQYNVPSFKIISSQCLHKVRIGEQISVVRVKVSWPLSAREALLHYFEFEYFQDDLIVVLINSIGTDTVDQTTYGIDSDLIPESKDMVRIGLVGGFAIQKVTPDRSYFRTIASMDMKLDFVPPSLINFISRQLIGNGFKLYQKAVASVAKRDEDFNKALGDAMYSRIREALYSKDQINKVAEPNGLSKDASIREEDNLTRSVQNDMIKMDQICPNIGNDAECSPDKSPVREPKVICEIEEEGSEENMHSDEESEKILHLPAVQVGGNCRVNNEKKIRLRPEVVEALGTLDKVISMVRSLGLNAQIKSSGSVDKEYPHSNIRKDAGEDLEDDESSSELLLSVKASKETPVEMAPVELRNGISIHNPMNTRSNSCPREVNHNRVAPTSPEQNVKIPMDTHQVMTLISSTNGVLPNGSLSGAAANNDEHISTDISNIGENSLEERKKKLNRQRKNRFCFCWHYVSEDL